MASLNETFSPMRELAHHAAMMVREGNMSRDAQVASITAILEGTMAAAVQIFGAEDAFWFIQPLVDKVLNAAVAAQIEDMRK
jgi:hypothetical protein